MYVIKTPNPNYDGTTHGVKFSNGAAVVEDEGLRKILVHDYGYTLEEDESKPEELQVSVVKAPKPRKTAAKSSGK
ncbi:hypothetical protein [Paenibacillus odorifer]|uniref:Uncharacterized protein n=1 Tax=Paenibacillus odorifer TaxID=189426 RepID=A0A1R0WUX2_9BACL|nr:hypothetical protein [Paenibacillus odorifer]OMD21697.1 hypothetical protein BJP51_31995 [Paenibacillus odorifer]